MLEFMFVSAMGAIAQELVHWYDLRKKLSTKRVSSLLRSKEYWLITALMISLTPVCCWILFGDESINKQLQFLSGAGFPLILKKAISALSESDKTNLGDSSIRDYFLMFSMGGRS
ncbi:MAG: hypothetical protein AAF526_00150 [Pseudomonadota bacterium]